MYLKTNDLGLESCGYKGYEEEIVRFMKDNIEFMKKIMMFYDS